MTDFPLLRHVCSSWDGPAHGRGMVSFLHIAGFSLLHFVEDFHVYINDQKGILLCFAYNVSELFLFFLISNAGLIK